MSVIKPKLALSLIKFLQQISYLEPGTFFTET
mgnify:CR=1 FL=1